MWIPDELIDCSKGLGDSLWDGALIGVWLAACLELVALASKAKPLPLKQQILFMGGAAAIFAAVFAYLYHQKCDSKRQYVKISYRAANSGIEGPKSTGYVGPIYMGPNDSLSAQRYPGASYVLSNWIKIIGPDGLEKARPLLEADVFVFVFDFSLIAVD